MLLNDKPRKIVVLIWQKFFIQLQCTYITYIYTYTMNAGKIIHRDIMLWHDKNSTLHRIYNHDFVFRFRMYMNEYLLRTLTAHQFPFLSAS